MKNNKITKKDVNIVKSNEKYDSSYMKRDDYIGKLRETAKENGDASIESSVTVKRNGNTIEQPSVIEIKEISKEEQDKQDEIDQMLVGRILKREQEMRSAMEQHLKRYDRNEKLVNEHLFLDKYTSAFAFMGVRDVSQKLVPPEFDIIGKKPNSNFASKVIYMALENELNKSKYRLSFIKGYRNACIYGENFRLISLHNSDIDGYYGVSFDNLTPKEILIDDRCRQFLSSTGKGDAVDCIIKYHYSFEDFMNEMKDTKININGKTYDVWKNIDKVKSGAIIDGDYTNGSKYIEVLFYYNRVQDRQIIVAGSEKTVIRDIPLFTRIGKRKCLPVIQISMFNIAGSNRFQGIPDLIANLNKMKNDGMRLGAEHALEMGKTVTFINTATEVDREALANRDPFIEVFVPQGADPNSLFMQHQLNPLGAEYYNLIEQTLSNDAVARIGSDFTTFSQETKHASTQIQRSEYTDSMIRRIMEENELQAETDFLRIVMCLMIDSFNNEKWKELLDDNTYIELVSIVEDGGYKNIGDYLSYYLENVDINIEVGSIVEPNRQAKRQQLTDALMSIQPNNPMYNVIVKELLTTILPSKKMDIEAKFKEAEMMQGQLQMQQQMQIEAQKQEINNNGDNISNGVSSGNSSGNLQQSNIMGNSTISNGGAQQNTGKMSGDTTQQVVQRGLANQLKNDVKNKSGK